MAVDLGLDDLLAAATKQKAGGFRASVEALLERAFRSDRNEFGEGAVITAADLQSLVSGQIIEFVGSSVPAGFLECNGAEVARNSYQSLFSAIGSTYGTAQSLSNFVLPDLRGAAAIGAGGTRVAGPNTSVGSEWNSDTVTLTSANMPRHSHTISEDSDSAGGHTHEWDAYPPFAFRTNSSRTGRERVFRGRRRCAWASVRLVANHY